MWKLPFISLSASYTKAALTYKGTDWSSLLVEEASGTTYKNTNNAVQPFETILQTSGVNTVRQRLWNDPADETYILTYNLELSQRAQAAGLNVYLDFHFSDTWADPAHQSTPSAWQDYGIDDLAYAVYNYTLATMNAFQTAGIPLSLVSIGNEISAGLLWPLGDMSTSDGPYNVARLLHSASAGIKDSDFTTQPKILIHVDDGWDYDKQEWWYDTILAQGPLTDQDYDVQAVSYYSFYNSAATLAALEASLTQLRGEYGKDVMVVETDWPTSFPNPSEAFPSDVEEIPFSAAGQSEWLEKVADVVEDAGGSGLFYWEPAWLGNAGLGSSCEDLLMFDWEGRALSSVSTFGSL
ncbi:Arabinogalactan endo-beta-1,4-galactanase A [Fulvia fulva]|uniref:Arabinogalactan endo-beta-1,4-galactanase n=1 Tax=Passalora fulva TaxID=5499 RepID=A0A9Q8P9G2_PASFU|nr:Arabinogalactan endo-beta-1,4-galactanase A [Fulvia fulva]KAK4625788.1 Arabinogalactan endo-beta-1,4-galactanase A [Fulvia fulva]UJO17911.1 Arabinogalactan endo-beta-1,4-galactanase A [Fulvia fulva]